VKVVQADISQEEQVRRLMTGIEASLPPLRGIIHSAGVLDDGVMLQQNWQRFSRVMAPKVMGTWHLHTQTKNQPLDFFVMFSSAASLLGSPGQSNHASANAFLDALAYHRKAQGLPALSINWGAWSEIGAARGQVSERVKMKGMETIAPQEGIRLLEQLFGGNHPQVGVVPIVWPVFIQQFQAGMDPPLMAELAPGAREMRPNATAAQPGNLLDQWSAAVPEERQSCLVGYIRAQVSKVMGLGSTQLNIDQPLNTMGLDSLMAVELRNRIKIDSALDVPLVKFMEDFSVISLATEMNRLLQESQASRSPVETPNDTGLKDVSPLEAGRILSQLDQLTDEEVDTLLRHELALGPQKARSAGKHK
jgi:myxalamid-type polyketide synthase MxaB